MRRLGERHRPEPALRVAAHLLGADLRVEHVRQLQRDHPPGRVGRPLLEVPVVPRAHARERELGILGDLLQSLSGEPRQERREVQRRVDPVEVHVVDSGRDVPGAAAHLVEAGRVEAVLVDRAADHGVEPDVGQQLAVVEPHLPTVVDLHDPWRALRERGGHPALEGVRRLHHVVVTRDHRERAVGAGRVGQERDLALHVVREARVPAEVVEGDRHERSVASVPPGAPGIASNGWPAKRAERPEQQERSERPEVEIGGAMTGSWFSERSDPSQGSSIAPKRRLRPWYSRIASQRFSRRKSGQSTSVKTSSEYASSHSR